MRALLLADFYQGKKYCRSVFLLVALFGGVTVFYANMGVQNMFFPLYGMLMTGMISMNLLAYDEQSHWNEYAQTMPCTRKMQVTVKYLDSLICVGVVWALFTAVYVAIAIRGDYSPGDVLALSAVLLMVGLISPAFLLPTVFRYGVNKGRLVYFVLIIAAMGVGAGLMTAGSMIGDTITLIPISPLPGWVVMSALALIAAALFAGSWALSVRWYEKRELAS